MKYTGKFCKSMQTVISARVATTVGGVDISDYNEAAKANHWQALVR